MRLFAIYRPVLREIPRKTGLFLCFHGFFRLFSFPGLFWTLHVFQHPLFIDKIKHGLPLTVTDGAMTRFIMNLNEAVDLVLYAFENGSQGDLFVQKADACTIEVLTQAIKELFGVPDYPTQTIGIRHGEKMYETLLTNEECARAVDCGMFYRVIADNRDLNYEKYLSLGNKDRNTLTEFNSNNTRLLDVEQTKKKLLTSKLVTDELEAWGMHEVS